MHFKFAIANSSPLFDNVFNISIACGIKTLSRINLPPNVSKNSIGAEVAN